MRFYLGYSYIIQGGQFPNPVLNHIKFNLPAKMLTIGEILEHSQMGWGEGLAIKG